MLFIQQLVTFLSALFQSITNKQLMDAGRNEVKADNLEDVVSAVQKANAIGAASDVRDSDFFLRDPKKNNSK